MRTIRLRKSGIDDVQEDLGGRPSDDTIDDLSKMMRSFAETASQSDNACFRQVVEAIPDAVIIHRHGRIIYANPAAVVSMSDQDPEALVGRRVFDFVAADDHDRLGEMIQSVMTHGGASDIGHYVRIGPDGQRYNIETVAARIMSSTLR